MAFNINGRIQLQGPTNVSRIVADVNRQLQGISANVQIKLDTSSISTLNNFHTAITQLSRSTQSVNKDLTETQQLMFQLGEQSGLAAKRFLAFSVAAGAMITFVQTTRQGVNAALQFQRELIRLEQVSNDSKETIQDVANTVSKLAITFGVSSADLIKSATVLRQAGLSADETKKSLEALAVAAQSPNFDTFAKNTEAIIAILSQFKKESLDIRQVFGSINAVASEFAVEGKDIGDAVTRAGGAFASLGGKMNEFIAIFTSVRATTREGADSIATGLRTIFSRLQSDQTISALQDLRVNLRFTADEAARLGNVNLTNQFVGPYEAIRRISQALKDIPPTDPTYAKVIEQIGGTRQTSRVLPLLQESAVRERALSLAEAGGASAFGAASKAQESLLVKAKQVAETYNEVFRGIADSQGFQTFAKGLLSIAEFSAKAVDGLRPLIPLLGALAIAKTVQSVFAFGTGFANKFASPVTSNYYNVRGYSRGGIVDGPPSNVDSVYGHLQPGEFVVRKAVAQQVGYDRLNRLNSGGLPHFAEGGSTSPYINNNDYEPGIGTLSQIFQQIRYSTYARSRSLVRYYQKLPQEQQDQISQLTGEKLTFVGNGAEGVVVSPNQDEVVRLALLANKQKTYRVNALGVPSRLTIPAFTGRPNLEGVLQPTRSDIVNRVLIERLPKVATFAEGEDFSEKELKDLRLQILTQGYAATDVHPFNVGRLRSGQPVVIDPGFLRKINNVITVDPNAKSGDFTKKPRGFAEGGYNNVFDEIRRARMLLTGQRFKESVTEALGHAESLPDEQKKAFEQFLGGQAKYLTSGSQASVFQLNKNIVARLFIPEEANFSRPNIPELLQPQASSYFGKLFAEKLPKIRTVNLQDPDEHYNAMFDMYKLNESLDKRGYIWNDMHRENIGYLPNNQPIILDPGGVNKKYKYATGGLATRSFPITEKLIRNYIDRVSGKTGFDFSKVVSGVNIFDETDEFAQQVFDQYGSRPAAYFASSRKSRSGTLGVSQDASFSKLGLIVPHELGHALDRYLGNVQGYKDFASLQGGSIEQKYVDARIDKLRESGRFNDSNRQGYLYSRTENFADLFTDYFHDGDAGFGKRSVPLSQRQLELYRTNILGKAINYQRQGFNGGGFVNFFASGGMNRDSILAALTPGEYIVNPEATARIGVANLERANRTGKFDHIPGFNRGGYVGGLPAYAAGSFVNTGVSTSNILSLVNQGTPLKDIEDQLTTVIKQEIQLRNKNLPALQAEILARQEAVKATKFAVQPQNDLRQLNTQISIFQKGLANPQFQALISGTPQQQAQFQNAYNQYLSLLQQKAAILQHTTVSTNAGGDIVGFGNFLAKADNNNPGGRTSLRQVINAIATDASLAPEVVNKVPTAKPAVGFFNRTPDIQETNLFSLLKVKSLSDVQSQLNDVYKKKILAENPGVSESQAELLGKVRSTEALRTATSGRNNLDKLDTTIARLEKVVSSQAFLDPNVKKLNVGGVDVSKDTIYQALVQAIAKRADLNAKTGVLTSQGNIAGLPDFIDPTTGKPAGAFVDKQAAEFRRLQIYQRATLGASIALPVLSDLASRGIGNAEQSIRSGREGLYQGVNAATTAATAGLAVGGAVAATGFGAPAAIPAGVIAALIAGISSLFDSSKEIVNVKVNDSFERLGTTIKVVNEQFEKLGKLNISDVDDLSRGISDILGNLQTRLRDEGTSPEGVKKVLGTDPRLLSAIGAIQQEGFRWLQEENPSLRNNPEELLKRFNEDERFGGRRFNEVAVGRSDYNLSLRQLFSLSQSGNFNDYNADRLSRNAAQRSVLESQTSISNLNTGRLATAFGALRNAVARAADDFDRFDILLNNITTSVSGNINISRYKVPDVVSRGELSNPAFQQEFNQLAATFGQPGLEAQREIGNILRVFQELRPALQTVITTGRPDSLTNELRGRLGIQGQASPLDPIVQQIGQILSSERGQPLDRSNIDRRLGEVQTQLLEGVKPMLDAFKTLEQQINRFIAGLEAATRLQLQASQAFGRAAGGRFQYERQEAVFAAQRQLRTDYTSFITPEQERRPFQESVRQLLSGTSLAGNANVTPEVLGARLQEIQGALDRLKTGEGLGTTFNAAAAVGQGFLGSFSGLQTLGQSSTGVNTVQSQQTLAVITAQLQNQAARFKSALDIFTNASERSAGAQARLTQLYQDRESRLNFAGNYLSADAEGRSNIVRGLLLTREAYAQGGNLNNFSQENTQLILQTLQSLGKTQLGFANGIQASDLYNQFVNTTTGILPQGSKDQETKLQAEIGEAYKQAATAAQELAKANAEAARLINVNLQSFQGGGGSFGEAFLNRLGEQVIALQVETRGVVAAINRLLESNRPQRQFPGLPADYAEQERRVPSYRTDTAPVPGANQPEPPPAPLRYNPSIWDRIREALAASSTTPGFAEGGTVYANQGFFKPKGTDTVPAMLTEGEFVVNKAATQANYGLLHRINAAKSPVNLHSGGLAYLADGGDVNPDERLAIISRSLSYNNTTANFSATLRGNRQKTANISWGDDTVDNINLGVGTSLAKSHDYGKAGAYQLTLNVTDDVGNTVNGGSNVIIRPPQAAQPAGGFGLQPGQLPPPFPQFQLPQTVFNFVQQGLGQGLVGLGNLQERQRLEEQRIRDRGVREALARPEGPLGIFQAYLNGGQQANGDIDANAGLQAASNAFQTASANNLLSRQLLSQYQNTFASQSLQQQNARIAGGFAVRQDVLNRAAGSLYPPGSDLSIRQFRGQFYNQATPLAPRRFAFGGYTGAYNGAGDNIPAYLAGGEFVLRRGVVQQNGLSAISAFNDTGDASALQKSQNGSLTAGAGSQSFAELQQSIQLFANTASPLITALNNFNREAQALADAMTKFPTSLHIEGRQTVEVILNGAEILASLQGDIAESIKRETTDQLSNFFKKNLPDVPQL